MPDLNAQNPHRQLRVHYRGRLGQIPIYFGKFLRMLLYQNDWKVLPMAALIAGLVGMVIKGRIFVYMEGSLVSALAIVCVCVWNGCFNSIQVICRERDVVKREHRSGMHISSYITAHMLYQAILCLIQTGITIYILSLVGIKYPAGGMITPFFVLDFGISLFLITYAADMMALWISSLCRTTTTAMTVMPVVLIFQLIFSGGLMTLPAQAEPITNLVICNSGLKLIATQSDYNNLPLASAWNTVWGMRKNRIRTTVTVGQVLDYLGKADDPDIKEIREIKVVGDNELTGVLTVGELVDFANAQEDSEEIREQTITIDTTIEKIIRMIGADEVRSYILETSSAAARVDDYEYTPSRVAGYWGDLFLFIFAFSALAVITLEFIDKDKR